MTCGVPSRARPPSGFLQTVRQVASSLLISPVSTTQHASALLVYVRFMLHSTRAEICHKERYYRAKHGYPSQHIVSARFLTDRRISTRRQYLDGVGVFQPVSRHWVLSPPHQTTRALQRLIQQVQPPHARAAENLVTASPTSCRTRAFHKPTASQTRFVRAASGSDLVTCGYASACAFRNSHKVLYRVRHLSSEYDAPSPSLLLR